MLLLLNYPILDLSSYAERLLGVLAMFVLAGLLIALSGAALVVWFFFRGKRGF